MQIGDVVRLRQPFRPEPYLDRTYRYGVVVGLVRDEEGRDEEGAEMDSGSSVLMPVLEVVVYLYDLQQERAHQDITGNQPLYCFYAAELDGVARPGSERNGRR